MAGSPAATDALYVLAGFVLVTGLAQALGVVPEVFAAKRLGLDVIDFNGGGYKAAFRALTAKGFGVNPSIT